MAYNEKRTRQVRELLRSLPEVTERKMFGSVGFMVSGHLAITVGDHPESCMMARLGKADVERAATQSGAAVARMRGRPMAGWVSLSENAVSEITDMERWIQQAVDFVSTLPPKQDTIRQDRTSAR